MKTQVFKNNETTATSNLLMLVTMIIFSGILIVANNNKSSFSGNSFSTSGTKQENEKLLINIKPMDKVVSGKNKTVKNPVSEIEYSVVKMQEYLIPENEPELEAGIANSIVFPDVETVEPEVTESASKDNSFLSDLKKQASEKTNATVGLYAFEKKIRGYLTNETEKPLELEDWMTNEKCWCTKSREALAEKHENNPGN
jgi:hypothetical protein